MSENNQYTAGSHLDRVAGPMIAGDKVMVGRSADGKVTVSIKFGEESVTVWCDPARARQIAASLLNKADTAEGLK